MITARKKIELIRKLSEKHGITSYQIGQETEVSTKTAYNILTSDEIKPRNKTLNIILDYLENTIVGTEAQYGLSSEITAKQKNIILKEDASEYTKKKSSEQFKQLPIDQKLNLLYEIETQNHHKLDVISSALGKILLDIEEVLEPTNKKLKKP